MKLLVEAVDTGFMREHFKCWLGKVKALHKTSASASQSLDFAETLYALYDNLDPDLRTQGDDAGHDRQPGEVVPVFRTG